MSACAVCRPTVATQLRPGVRIGQPLLASLDAGSTNACVYRWQSSFMQWRTLLGPSACTCSGCICPCVKALLQAARLQTHIAVRPTCSFLLVAPGLVDMLGDSWGCAQVTSTFSDMVGCVQGVYGGCSAHWFVLRAFHRDLLGRFL